MMCLESCDAELSSSRLFQNFFSRPPVIHQILGAVLPLVSYSVLLPLHHPGVVPSIPLSTALTLSHSPQMRSTCGQIVATQM